MPVYTCPECSTKIKRNNAVDAGKKLKCPECSAVFTVRAEKKAEPAKAAAASAPKSEWDDDGPMNYGLSHDEDTKESQKEREKAYGPMKERFEKSKRGPALEMVVKPATFLLMCGVITCMMSLTTGVVATWPMIFKSELVEEKGKKSLYDVGEKKTKFRELSTDEYKTRLVWLVAGVFYFLWGGVICLAASRMNDVSTYWLAMLGSIMCFIGPFLPLGVYLAMEAFDGATDGPDMALLGPAIICFAIGIPFSVWNIMTLLQAKVKAGFADKAPIV